MRRVLETLVLSGILGALQLAGTFTRSCTTD